MEAFSSQFSDITGCRDEDQLRFFYESSGGQLELAVELFYAQSKDGDDDEVKEEQTSVPRIQRPQLDPERDPISLPRKQPIPKEKASSSRFATLSSIKQRSGEIPDDFEDSDSQRWFTGGDKSGMLVEAPKDQSNPARSLVQSIFQKAQSHQTHEMDESADSTHEDTIPRKAQEENQRYFTGLGYTLGDDHTETKVISKEINTRSSNANPLEHSQTLKRKLVFYRNGFVIDEGSLRSYEDQENQLVLKELSEGHVPREIGAQPGQKVEVAIEHRMQEEYHETVKKSTPAFTGEGYRLGNISNVATIKSTTHNADQKPANLPASSSLPFETKGIDKDQPLTHLQIRFGDGTRCIAQFNQSNTISDVRSFINASRPNDSSRPYILMTTFPNRELIDESQSLVESGLLNAVIVQHYMS